LKAEHAKERAKEGAGVSHFKWVNLSVAYVGKRNVVRPSTRRKQFVPFQVG